MGERAYGQGGSGVTLDGADVGRLLRLWRRLHAPDARLVERKRRLILGLCDLLGAHSGASVVTVLAPDTGRREVVSVVRATTGGRKLLPVPWHESPGNASLFEAPRRGHPIESSLDLHGSPTLVAFLTLVRGGGGSSAARAVAVLRLVHEECGWLYAADHLLASSRVRRLPPPRRHVLQYLLAGESEADMARWLRMGVRAVRTEARAAYQALGAADLEELLAPWSSNG